MLKRWHAQSAAALSGAGFHTGTTGRVPPLGSRCVAVAAHTNSHLPRTPLALTACPDVQVWDYVGDNYVHRLIQSKTDGKLVEVPSPMPGPGGSPRRAGSGPTGRHSCGAGAGAGHAHAGAMDSCGGVGARGGRSGDHTGHSRLAGARGAPYGPNPAGTRGPYSSDDYDDYEAEEDDGMEEAMMASKLDHLAAGECDPEI